MAETQEVVNRAVVVVGIGCQIALESGNGIIVRTGVIIHQPAHVFVNRIILRDQDGKRGEGIISFGKLIHGIQKALVGFLGHVQFLISLTHQQIGCGAGVSILAVVIDILVVLDGGGVILQPVVSAADFQVQTGCVGIGVGLLRGLVSIDGLRVIAAGRGGIALQGEDIIAEDGGADLRITLVGCCGL